MPWRSAGGQKYQISSEIKPTRPHWLPRRTLSYLSNQTVLPCAASLWYSGNRS